MAIPLRPQHFLSRDDGTLTALIAVDELPHYVSIRGVPRNLNHTETQGMTSLGSVKSRGQFYLIDHLLQQPQQHVHPRRDGNNADLATVVRPELYPLPHGMPLAPQGAAWNHGLQGYEGQGWKNVRPNDPVLVKQNPGNRQGKSSAGIKKEYCSFWLRHGECDYQQQGCIFKHEMPLDKSILEKLGLRDIPRWYRDKHGVKSISGNTNGASSTNGTPGRIRTGVWRNGSQLQIDRNDVPTNRLLTSGPHEDMARALNDASAHYSSSPGLTRGLNPSLPSTERLNLMGPVGNLSFDDASSGSRYDLISMQDSPALDNAGRAPVEFRPIHSHPEVRANQDQLTNCIITGGSSPLTSRKHSSDIITGSSQRNNVSSSAPYNSLWTLHENCEDDLSMLQLPPFQSIEQASQSKKRHQRSRRLYQRRNSPGRSNETERVTELEIGAGENKGPWKPCNLAPIDTTTSPTNAQCPFEHSSSSKVTPEAISPCFSPHPPSGSYTSSLCSPHSGPANGRLSDIVDAHDKEGMSINHNGRVLNDSPGSAETDNQSVNCDLYDLGFNHSTFVKHRKA
ncbi:hypothetical protein FQN57_007329 [Myotisia sp. PD_48]|nr:hypothetical protein FQN57_007329 [Myotisia sp. PD_48]